MDSLEERALARLDVDALARDTGRLVRAASPTGTERAVMELAVEVAGELGLEAQLVEHDLAALRAHPGHPGEEAPRDEAVSMTATLRGAGERRLALNGHLDTVGPGTVPWADGDPWSGRVADGFVHGRGSLDMKGGWTAALHAMAAVRAAGEPGCEVVIQGVPSEEDGGLGTFAALEHDDRFDAALIPEPTAFELVCAHGGALTFHGVIRGRAAHAAYRLDGESALDRYVPVHAALQELERNMNAGVDHPLMRHLELPYPLLVGRIESGRWSSVVPDRLEFEGRVGVPLGATPANVRKWTAEAVGTDVELSWTGGQFNAAETPVDDPFAQLAIGALRDELGRDPVVAGVPYAADMRLFVERGIPCVMAGPSGLDLIHAVDERVPVADLAATARAIIRVISRFG